MTTNTPLSDALEANRIAMEADHTPAYGEALALCRRLESALASAPAQPVTMADERAAFDAALVEAGYGRPSRNECGDLVFKTDQDRYVGWKLAVSDQRIIGSFLERTGQYVTNDASREAAIADAIRAAISAQPTPTMDDAIAAGDGTLHGAIDHWQAEAEKYRKLYEETARAVPEGWKLVPVEPTSEMTHAGRYGGDPDRPPIGARPAEGVTAWPFVGGHTAAKIFKAMLAAAPQPPAPSEQRTDSDRFKNFHRSLCERFGYTHDETDWRRDLVSLEEFIAAKVAHGIRSTGGEQ